VVLAACSITFGVRVAGGLEPADLRIHDQLLAAVTGKQAVDHRIVLVIADDQDIVTHGWPLNDDLLAQVLERIMADGPRAIGVDLYRDIPIQPGAERLRETLQRYPEIIMTSKIGDGISGGISPPAYLRGTDQVGFADMVVDPDGVVRRGLLYLNDGEQTHAGFGLQLALRYLQPERIAPAPDEGNPEYLRLGRSILKPVQPDEGAYVEADAGGFQILLDYGGGVQPFPTVSVGAVLAGTVREGLFRDRLAVIGISAQSVKDYFIAPHGQGAETVPGVALHGHIASQLIRMAKGETEPIAALGNTAEHVLILTLALCGALIGYFVRSPLVWLSAVAAGGSAILATAYAGLSTALWIPAGSSLLPFLLSSILMLTCMRYFEAMQRQELLGLFSSYVSKNLANELWERRAEVFDGGSGRLVAKPATVSVLFSDIRGFTTISERLPPAVLMAWLEDYTRVMADLVMSHGGFLDKFIGDAVMGVFGLPIPRQSEEEVAADAVSAVRCALAMGDALRSLNNTWAARGLPKIAVRIGIVTGPVIAGTLGSTSRLEYTVIGDTVNTASRLEGFDKNWGGIEAGEHLRVLISQSTAERLPAGDFTVEPVGMVELKGKASRVTVFRVLRYNGPTKEGMT